MASWTFGQLCSGPTSTPRELTINYESTEGPGKDYTVPPEDQTDRNKPNATQGTQFNLHSALQPRTGSMLAYESGYCTPVQKESQKLFIASSRARSRVFLRTLYKALPGLASTGFLGFSHTVGPPHSRHRDRGDSLFSTCSFKAPVHFFKLNV